MVLGSPTAGTGNLEFSPDNTDDVDVNWDDTAAEVQTALEGHSDLTSGDVSCSGGPFPNATVVVEFQGNYEETKIDPAACDWSSLTSANGLLCIRVQQGGPG